MSAAVASDTEGLQKTLKKPFKNISEKSASLKTVLNSAKSFEIEGEIVHIEICYP